MFKDGSRIAGGKAYRQHTDTKNHIRKLFNYTCQLCGRPGKDVDHIVPWKESHDSTVANLRVLCHSCNCRQRKLAHRKPDVAEWWAQIASEHARITHINEAV